MNTVRKMRSVPFLPSVKTHALVSHTFYFLYETLVWQQESHVFFGAWLRLRTFLFSKTKKRGKEKHETNKKVTLNRRNFDPVGLDRGGHVPDSIGNDLQRHVRR